MRRVLANVAVGILITVLITALIIGSVLAILPCVAVVMNGSENVVSTIDENLVKFYDTYSILWRPNLYQITGWVLSCGLFFSFLTILLDAFVKWFDWIVWLFWSVVPAQSLLFLGCLVIGVFFADNIWMLLGSIFIPLAIFMAGDLLTAAMAFAICVIAVALRELIAFWFDWVRFKIEKRVLKNLEALDITSDNQAVLMRADGKIEVVGYEKRVRWWPWPMPALIKRVSDVTTCQNLSAVGQFKKSLLGNRSERLQIARNRAMASFLALLLARFRSLCGDCLRTVLEFLAPKDFALAVNTIHTISADMLSRFQQNISSGAIEAVQRHE